MATQLAFWNMQPATKQGWNDVRLPQAYAEFYEQHKKCPNCHQPLRAYMHALNHYKKLHMFPRVRRFVFRYDMWAEVSKAAYLRAKKNKFATATTK
jgi:flagellar biosynthesis protein FliP